MAPVPRGSRPTGRWCELGFVLEGGHSQRGPERMGQPPTCEEGTAAPVTFHERGAISLALGGGWEEESGSREIWADASPAGAGGGQ